MKFGQHGFSKRGLFSRRYFVFTGSWFDLICVWIAPAILVGVGVFLAASLRQCA